MGKKIVESLGEKEKNIEELHKKREQLLKAIERGDQEFVTKSSKNIHSLLIDSSLNILNRVEGNTLRSYKNILLSHNTLYSYSAEIGGLSAWKSHYTSEKYAIMIEHTDKVAELDVIHRKMMKEYSEPSLRYEMLINASIVEKAEYYIAINLAEDISVEKIAANLHVNPSHLMRSFKKEKGITISHFRNKKRINEAKELLLHSNLSLTDIAYMVGFSSQQYFTKVFKKEENMSPLAFKKYMKKEK